MLQVKQDRSGSSRSKIHQLGRVFSQALYRVKTLHFFADIIHGWFLDGSKQATFPSSSPKLSGLAPCAKFVWRRSEEASQPSGLPCDVRNLDKEAHPTYPKTHCQEAGPHGLIRRKEGRGEEGRYRAYMITACKA